jgi:hypothetical protein
VAVEIGRLEGISTEWIACALDGIGAGHLHSIDIETKREAQARLAPYCARGTVTLHEFSSHGAEAARLAEALGEIDFLFVDGDHRTPAVRADCELWLPRVRQVALLHDWGQGRVQQGVKEATAIAGWENIGFFNTRNGKEPPTTGGMLMLRRKD